MDPFSAVSVASSIVQLIDFGGKLVDKGLRIYNSADGSLVEHVNKEAAIQHLVYLTTKLQDSAPTILSDDTTSQVENHALHALCAKCRIVGEELLDCLRAVRVDGKNRKWKSFRQALRSVSTEETITSIETRLAALKDELEFHVLVDLRKNVNLLSVQQSSQFKNLDRASQEITKAVIHNDRVFTDKLSAQTIAISQLHKQTETSVNSGLDKLGKDIIHELHSSLGGGYFRQSPNEDFVPRTPRQLEQEKRLRENAILQSLSFSSMGDRHRDIIEGHKNTFKWMFDGIDAEEEDSEAQASNFVEWLKVGNGIYWINGKAGSGKSTLMRYLYNHADTRRHLYDWSGPYKLYMGGFFFWNSGTSDQRTQSGLFRSLLYEILSKQRDWIRDLFPDRWLKLTEWAEDASDKVDQGHQAPISPRYKWSLTQLRHAFNALIDKRQSLARFCLFIDGLDEYEGECGHAELVDILTDLTASNHLKVCVSSRPWVVFEDAFQGTPGIKLESLTYGDIKQYVSDILGRNPRMVRLCQAEPDEAPKLMEDIVTKAQGVFLWVELVVRSLLSGLANRDRIRDLQARLRLLPERLEDLYKVMLLRIDPYYRHQAAQLFLLVQTHQMHTSSAKHNLSGERSALTILKLAFADSEDAVSMAIESPLIPLTDSEINAICESTDARLRSRCAGLLETSASRNITHLWTWTTEYDASSRVDYLHRTARDFLESPETQTLLYSWNEDAENNCNIALLAACISELKCVTLGLASMWLSIADAMTFAQDTKPLMANFQWQLLDELDAAASESWVQFRETGPRREDPSLHWSHYIPIQYDGSSASRREAFILYAAQHGLHDYVEYKRRIAPELFSRKTMADIVRYQRQSSVGDASNKTGQGIPASRSQTGLEVSKSMMQSQNTTSWDYRQKLMEISDDEDDNYESCEE